MKGTIKSKEDVERLFSQGRRSTSSSMSIIVGKSGSPNLGRCAFIAGKKLGPAPFRSRCKRVMREVARSLGAPWNGYDIVFLARKSVAYEDHEEVARQARKCLAKMGIIDDRG
ncbi:MAG: ribonuclease P protein component [Coriobacteriales bacterium]